MKRTLIATLTLMLTVAAFAAPPGRRAEGQRGGRGMRQPGRLAELLNLTESQRASVKALRDAQKSKMQPLIEQRRANREALKAALDAGDAAKAGELAVANHQLRSQFRAAHESFQTSLAALLTAEQKAKWELMREMRETRRSHRQRR